MDEELRRVVSALEKAGSFFCVSNSFWWCLDLVVFTEGWCKDTTILECKKQKSMGFRRWTRAGVKLKS